MPKARSPRIVLTATLLLLLGGTGATIPTAAHSDRAITVEDPDRRDAWEGAVGRLDRGAGPSGGVSDGDDWLG
jgi:hypothetical protein